jgi:hypothetical protein
VARESMVTFIIPTHNEELLIGRTISDLHFAAGAIAGLGGHIVCERDPEHPALASVEGVRT